MDGSNNLVLDTNIILYSILYNDEDCNNLIRYNNIFISDITEIELLGYSKLEKSEKESIEKILSAMSNILLNGTIKKNRNKTEI